jgi:hypothetical protein
MQLHNDPEWLFPFEMMEVGDSFFIPTLKNAPLIYAIETGAKRAKVKVKTCSVVEGDYMGVRTWRIG